jgi:hypothetical protein
MLVPCNRCKRHHDIRDEVCPFCRHGSALAKIGAAALSAGVLLAGCDAGKTKSPEQGSAVAKRTYATLSGRVTNRSGGTGATMVSISSTEPSPNRSFSETVASSNDGQFMLDLLEAGSYSVSFSYDDGTWRGTDQRQVTLKAGDDEKLDVVLDLNQQRDMDTAKPYGAPPARRRRVV